MVVLRRGLSGWAWGLPKSGRSPGRAAGRMAGEPGLGAPVPGPNVFSAGEHEKVYYRNITPRGASVLPVGSIECLGSRTPSRTHRAGGGGG